VGGGTEAPEDRSNRKRWWQKRVTREKQKSAGGGRGDIQSASKEEDRRRKCDGLLAHAHSLEAEIWKNTDGNLKKGARSRPWDKTAEVNLGGAGPPRNDVQGGLDVIQGSHTKSQKAVGSVWRGIGEVEKWCPHYPKGD